MSHTESSFGKRLNPFDGVACHYEGGLLLVYGKLEHCDGCLHNIYLLSGINIALCTRNSAHVDFFWAPNFHAHDAVVRVSKYVEENVSSTSRVETKHECTLCFHKVTEIPIKFCTASLVNRGTKAPDDREQHGVLYCSPKV
jgi:hypothetical protein